MKSNFYEKIIHTKTEEERDLLNQMNGLLEESIDTLIYLRKRQSVNNDINNIFKSFLNSTEFTLSQSRENINNDNIIFFTNRLRQRYVEVRISRRRTNIENERERLNRRQITPNRFLESID